MLKRITCDEMMAYLWNLSFGIYFTSKRKFVFVKILILRKVDIL